MAGEIRSVFLMTEPRVASSDATNIETRIELDARTDEYVINGRKWWATGAGDPRCKLIILMGRVANSHAEAALPTAATQQTMILIPMDAAGVEVWTACPPSHPTWDPPPSHPAPMMTRGRWFACLQCLGMMTRRTATRS